jgi:hypothetical protein
MQIALNLRRGSAFDLDGPKLSAGKRMKNVHLGSVGGSIVVRLGSVRHGGRAVIVAAAIAHVHFANSVANQVINLLYLCAQRVAIVGICGETLDADELSATAAHCATLTLLPNSYCLPALPLANQRMAHVDQLLQIDQKQLPLWLRRLPLGPHQFFPSFQAFCYHYWEISEPPAP